MKNVYQLKKISPELINKIYPDMIDNFRMGKMINFNKKEITEKSIPVYYNKEEVLITIDLNEYYRILNNNDFYYKKDARISMLLVKDLVINEDNELPLKIINDRNVWIYLNLVIFYDLIIKRYDMSEDTINDKIFLINGIKSRHGFRFLWSLTKKTESSKNVKRAELVYEFIDSIKAIYERNMSKNNDILNAFVDCIEIIDDNSYFKNKIGRRLIPTHLSCFAATNYIDGYDYDELVSVFVEQAKKISE